eukprot:g47578.t1
MILNPDAKLKEVTNIIDEARAVDVAYIDFTEAFNKVPHGMLVQKIKSHGIYSELRQVFSALGQIAKHSVDLAEMVVEAEIFPAVLTCLKDSDEFVKKNVATLIREIAKHTPE